MISNDIDIMLISEQIEMTHTAQKTKFSIRDFFSKCDQSRSFLRIWSHLLKKSLMENFIFCAVTFPLSHFIPEGLLHYAR